MRIFRHWQFAAVASTAVFFSALLALDALWIPLKAALAQQLIERSWRLAASGGETAPPWPWADTRPVARLSAPAQGVELFVLEGNSGRNLAFGPVLGGDIGLHDRVISGHRDTHFRFLKRLQIGDRLRLQTVLDDHWYVVSSTEVVDSRTAELVLEPGALRLSLVTCYPFDSPRAGGPLRYVVTALPLPELSRRSASSG